MKRTAEGDETQVKEASMRVEGDVAPGSLGVVVATKAGGRGVQPAASHKVGGPGSGESRTKCGSLNHL